MHPVLTLGETAEVLRLPDEAAVRALIVAGDLGAVKLPNGELRVIANDLRIFLRARRVDGAEAM